MLGDLIKASAALLGTSKDELIARALKPAINIYLDGAGTVESVEIDSVNKTVIATLAMVGEDKPVVVRVERYSIEPDPKGCALVVHDFSSPSHQWIATVAKKFSPEIRIPLPVTHAIAEKLL